MELLFIEVPAQKRSVSLTEVPTPSAAPAKSPLPTAAELRKLFHYSVISGALTPLTVDRRVRRHNQGYLMTSIRNTKYLAHRIIWAMVTGEYPETVDHINGVRDDNRWLNLRAASRADNNRNHSGWAKSKSGVKGVYPAKAKGRWEAKITVNCKSKSLGTFDSLHEAAEAYNKAASILYGEFAKLNKLTVLCTTELSTPKLRD